MNNISSSEIQSGFLARLHGSIQTKTKNDCATITRRQFKTTKIIYNWFIRCQNLQCIDRGQPWNQKALELVRGSPSTAFDFRSGLIWMWWFLRRFAAKKENRKQLKSYRKGTSQKWWGSIDNLRESRGHRWAFCPIYRGRWPRCWDWLIRTDRQHRRFASHERWQSSPSGGVLLPNGQRFAINLRIFVAMEIFNAFQTTKLFDVQRNFLQFVHFPGSVQNIAKPSNTTKIV